MSQKRTLLWVIFIVVIVILIWQVVAMFRGGSSSKSAPAPQPQPMPTLASTPAVSASAPVASMPLVAKAPVVAVPAQNNTSFDPLGGLNSPEQRRYLQMLSEYQLLQIQAQIVQVKLAIAQSQANMQKLQNNGATTASNSGQAVSVAPVDTLNPPARPQLTLKYIGQVNGAWSAMIQFGDTVQAVSVGSVLPSGETVVAIQQNAVVLNNHGRMMRLTL